MIQYYDNIEQSSPEWYQIREDYPLTGSTSYDLLLARNPENYVVKENNFGGNKWTERGHELEIVARDLLERVYEMKVHQTGFVTNTDYPHSGCSPDGYTDEYLVEIKCFSKSRHLANIATIEAKIMSQIQWNMMVLGKNKGLAVFFCPDKSLDPEQRLAIIEIEANQAVWSNMKSRILAYGKSRNSSS